MGRITFKPWCMDVSMGVTIVWGMGRIPSKPWCREVSKGVTIIQGDNLISVETPKDGDIKPVPQSPRKEKDRQGHSLISEGRSHGIEGKLDL